MGRVLVLIGPTASGKTKLAVDIAAEHGGEVVSADSMQIYKFMDICTAKPSKEEMQGVHHHMLSVADPREDYSAADYKAAALECIGGVLARGRLPIVAGGTGLYVSALLDNIDFAPGAARAATYREELYAEAAQMGGHALHHRLAALDPEAASAVHPNNTRRVIRALEMIHTAGKTKTELLRESKLTPPLHDFKVIGLDVDRDALSQRISARVDAMIAAGLVDEIRFLRENALLGPTASCAIGCREIIAHIEGQLSLGEAAEKIKTATRRYAKRQMTWFRRIAGVLWADPFGLGFSRWLSAHVVS